MDWRWEEKKLLRVSPESTAFLYLFTICHGFANGPRLSLCRDLLWSLGLGYSPSLSSGSVRCPGRCENGVADQNDHLGSRFIGVQWRYRKEVIAT